jgi:hypothetical protein
MSFALSFPKSIMNSIFNLRLSFSAIVALGLCFTLAFAQTTDKQITKAIKTKALKEAKKEAKKLAKEGWKVNPGSFPLEKVLQQSWEKQYAEDEKGQPVYLVADGNGVAESKSVAEMQAVELAKLQLAGLIETNINSLVSANLGNAQLSKDDAASVTEIVQSAKNLIQVELGYINPAFKIYRESGEKNIETQVRLFYDRKQSMDIAKKVVRKELKDKLKVNEAQLDKLIGLDK